MTLDISKLKIGDVFYECEYGRNLRAVVATKPELVDGQWRWKAKCDTGGLVTTIDYCSTVGFEHYGPRLYSEPMYASHIGNRIGYKIIGGEDIIIPN